MPSAIDGMGLGPLMGLPARLAPATARVPAVRLACVGDILLMAVAEQ